MKSRYPTQIGRILARYHGDILPSSALHLKAENFTFRGFAFHEADPREVIACLNWKQRHSCGNRWRKPRWKSNIPVIFLPAGVGENPPLITVSRKKRRLSLWDAGRITSVLSGLSLSIRGRFLILHDRQTVPQEFTILDELKRFPAWRPLACMDMKICGFGEATLEQVCNHLQEKLHLLARGTGDLKIEALEGETRPVTYITQHKITFAEWLWCVAELAGAKIIVEEKRILVMPSSP